MPQLIAKNLHEKINKRRMNESLSVSFLKKEKKIDIEVYCVNKRIIQIK